MSGKLKQKIYQYNRIGEFIKTFESQSALRSVYFPDDKGNRPLFVDDNYKILDDYTLISKEKLGRKKVLLIYRKEVNDFISLGNEKREIQVYNLDNIKIATFASIQIATKMTNISYNTIHYRLKMNSRHGNTDGLKFRYK